MLYSGEVASKISELSSDKLSALSAIIEIVSCGPTCDVNNRGPHLSYDWLLCKHQRKTPWEVFLKIKRYGTGLTQRVSMEDGSSG